MPKIRAKKLNPAEKIWLDTQNELAAAAAALVNAKIDSRISFDAWGAAQEAASAARQAYNIANEREDAAQRAFDRACAKLVTNGMAEAAGDE